MKNRSFIVCILFIFNLKGHMFPALGQSGDPAAYWAKDSVERKGFTLVFINKDPSFKPQMINRLKETFFTVYPVLAKDYNKKTAKRVVFVVDPQYDGVAATSEGQVVFSPKWFENHPEDIDVVTHEVMHIVQAYGNTPGPGWLTEGIADYVRYAYGVNNPEAGWSLPDVKAEQNYTNAYRVTARFLVWLEQRKDRKIVKKLDEVMRAHTYSEGIWKKLTGKTPDALWKEYVSDPKIDQRS
ncbi:MAG: basic secretory protein-like protein [Mangrovibacterium sp.]